MQMAMGLRRRYMMSCRVETLQGMLLVATVCCCRYPSFPLDHVLTLLTRTGYSVNGVETSSTGGILAKLALNGEGCRAFGNDIADLVLSVEYETEQRE